MYLSHLGYKYSISIHSYIRIEKKIIVTGIKSWSQSERFMRIKFETEKFLHLS